MTKLLCSLWLLLSCLFLQAGSAMPVPGSFVPDGQAGTAFGRNIDYDVPNEPAKSNYDYDYDAALMLPTGEKKLASLATRSLIGNFVKSVAAKEEAEILSRLGTPRESAARLARKAAEAEEAIGIHGVSTSAGKPVGPASQAARDAVESKFPVHNTPTRNDPLHRTVELPKPVTPEVAKEFNKVFGRE